jgi:CheY-like chemotaxis protein
MAGHNGVLNISLDEMTLSADVRTNYPELPGGNYVRLMVTDNGHGMSRDVLDRIFDPFFTTKEQGKGTGLGLSIAHGIVKSHKGHISAVSIVEGGTTFTILLPVTTEAESGGDETSRTQHTIGKAHILFVDDEADYTTTMKVVLERCGYQVTARTDSREVLELLRQDSFSCDLLISDQTMPQLTGTQLTAEIRKIRPDLPIILCSGSAPETEPAVSEANIAALGINKLLLKPVQRSELLATVEQLLSSKTGSGPEVANEQHTDY